MASKKKKVVDIDETKSKKPDAIALQIFEEFWKPLVCDSAGRLNRDKVIVELADFHLVMQEAAKVYHHVTGGRISKPNTLARDVIAVATDVDNEALEQILADEKEAWETKYEEVGLVSDVCYVALGGKTLAFEGRHARVATPEGEFVVAWCSDTDQMFTDDNKPLPHRWRDTARDAIKTLLEKPNA